MKARGRPWTRVDDTMIREFYPVMPKAALAAVIRRTTIAVRNRALTLGVRTLPETTARFARFHKGMVPWNKGKHYVAGGRSAETRFKPGSKPQTWVPVGTERVTKEGYLQRKVTDTGYTPADFVEVHRLLWEQHHGPIPADHAVVFRNNDRRDIRIENLELVSRADLMRRNSVHTRMPPELARLVQLRGALIRKINRIERSKPA